MDNILASAIQAVQNSEVSFTKFITANDAGATGAHQAGFHIHKNSWKLFWDKPGIKGENKDKFVTINWQNNFETDSRFIYYGTGTRNEYRLTRFGRGFPFLNDENIGNLLILIKKCEDYYFAYVLKSDEDIDEFLAAFNISSNDINGIIPKQFQQTAADKLIRCFDEFIEILFADFPSTYELASVSRNCYKSAYNITIKDIENNPDQQILQWLDAEFQLFKAIENNRYSKRIELPFKSVEELVETANTILNRRKSRAGKSLEHHLEEVFRTLKLSYKTQVITEENKRPDFLFPNAEAYMDSDYNNDHLVFLAAKTTCKDRWRQILNEAERIKTKHLFTLQQGISKNQLEEMYKYDVCLVVPKPYLSSFPPEFRDRIKTLNTFIEMVKYTQS